MFTDFPEIIVTACQFACIQRYPRNPRYRTSQFACLQRFHRNPRYRLQVSLHVDRWFSRNPRYRSPVCMLTKISPQSSYRLPNGSRYELLKNTSDAWKGKIFLIKIRNTMYYVQFVLLWSLIDCNLLWPLFNEWNSKTKMCKLLKMFINSLHRLSSCVR